MPQPTPSAARRRCEIPDPQGPGCDAFKTALPNWKALRRRRSAPCCQHPGHLHVQLAGLGQANPAVNIVPVLENGPYVVFAPTNEAFAALPPAQLDALKADPAALYKLDYYHVFLGLLGPDDVKGQRPTQQGAEIKVDGKGGDIKVNDTAKVVCGGIQSPRTRGSTSSTRCWIPRQPPEPITPTETSSTTTTTTTTSDDAARRRQRLCPPRHRPLSRCLPRTRRSARAPGLEA